MSTRSSHEPGAARPGGVPLCVPNISGNEWEYVKRCLDSGWVSSAGDYVPEFERQFAAAVDVPYAVAVATGTAALHLVLLAAGVKPDEEVLMPSLTFIAPANAVRYVGAVPVFLDVDPDHWQLDPDRVRQFLETQCEQISRGVRNRTTGRIVRALLPVDILGHPTDLGRLSTLADEFGLLFIEDATESLGAKYRGRKLGSIAPITAFSFNGNKLLTTGGGGMVTALDERSANAVRHLATQAKADPVEFVHDQVGFNYRMTNVQAALGLAQLERLPEFVERKHAIARRYCDELSGLPGVTLMREANWATSAFWMYTIRIDGAVSPQTSRDVMRFLDTHNVQARPLWQPLHLSPAHTRTSPRTACPQAELLQKECLSIPSSTGMTDEEQTRVISLLHEALA